ncbi:MAG TPA: type I methionyl aminopeptidase [Candidatus Paceibacterota bacterium]|nr:type I methionyl aminopeptidase [Candidatus Paceibacterota bacterium]
MTITDARERDTLIEAGRRLARVLAALREAIRPGVTAEALDDLAERLIRDGGDEPAFLGYTPEGSPRPYPATLCVSVNDEVVHGIPNEGVKTLKDGDIVGLDLGLVHDGIVVDAATTVPVGNVDGATRKLLAATEAALGAGIAAARPGAHVGDISHAIQEEIEGAGFAVVKPLGGHGVGDRVHEEPFIPNFGKPGAGPALVEGMVLALEPISSAGKGSVTLAPDGYTYRTKDGSRSAHFEHTILIEQGGARVVTTE